MWVNGEIAASQEETELGSGAQGLLACWDALRAGRSAPLRADLDLTQVKKLAPFLFIAERSRTGAGFTFRLAGTGLCALYGHELTGRDLLGGWESFERGVMTGFLNGVVTSHRQAAFRLGFLTDREQTLAAEMLALPLIARDGATHVLGGLFPVKDQALKPHAALTPAEVSIARFLGEAAREPQAPRKFHVITGGLR